MPSPSLNELNTATRVKIMPGLVDQFFKAGPQMATLKAERLKLFPGGTAIQENFLYKPMKGGAYAKGDQFDITKFQTKSGLQFIPKFYQVNVTEYPEDTEVFLRTPEAAFNTVQVDLANAALTLSAILEIDLMKHGQALAGDDRSLNMNGWEEAANNGTTVSWRNNLFPTYGGQSRVDGSVGNALMPAGGVGTPVVSANVGGPISNRVLEHSYQSAVIGSEHPKLGITTSRCMGYINENYMPMQRLQDTVEPTIGWPGLKFKQATIIESQYMPGADGVNDADIGNYLTPQNGGVAGETFMWQNPGGKGEDSFFTLHMSASPRYQFGFTGFKVMQDGTQLAGQILVALTFSVRALRLQRILYGITA